MAETSADSASYVLVGSPCLDRAAGQLPVLGGSVVYAARHLVSIGVVPTILTRCSEAMTELLREALPTVDIHAMSASHDLQFAYGEGDAPMGVIETVSPIRVSELGLDRDAKICHLAPIYHDVTLDGLPELRRKSQLLALTPQGLMRLDTDRGLLLRTTPELLDWIDLADVVVINELERAALSDEALARAPITVCTRSEDGATIYERGVEVAHVRSPRVSAQQTTGAGDVFTTALLVAFARAGDIRSAATEACEVAAAFVSQPRRPLAATEAAQRILATTPQWQ